MTTDIDRYIAGETLEGDAAREMLKEHESRPWRFWVRLALGYLRDGQVEQAMHMLEQLVDSDQGIMKRLQNKPVSFIHWLLPRWFPPA